MAASVFLFFNELNGQHIVRIYKQNILQEVFTSTKWFEISHINILFNVLNKWTIFKSPCEFMAFVSIVLHVVVIKTHLLGFFSMTNTASVITVGDYFL